MQGYYHATRTYCTPESGYSQGRDGGKGGRGARIVPGTRRLGRASDFGGAVSSFRAEMENRRRDPALAAAAAIAAGGVFAVDGGLGICCSALFLYSLEGGLERRASSASFFY
jgi:hypothetical protein